MIPQKAEAAEFKHVTPKTVYVSGRGDPHEEIQIRLIDSEGNLVAARTVTADRFGDYERTFELVEGYTGALEVIEQKPYVYRLRGKEIESTN